MKNLLVLSIIISIFLAGCGKEKTEYKIPTADVLTKGNTTEKDFVQKKLSKSVNNCKPGDSACSYIRLNYIEAAAGNGKDNINSLISSELMKAYEMPDKNLNNPQVMMDSFIKDYEAFKKKNPATAQTWMLDHNSRVYAETDKLYCLIFENASYLGGPHPVITTTFKTVFKETGVLVTLEVLLGPGFENRLSAAIEKNYRDWRNLGPSDDLQKKGDLFEKTLKFTNNFAVTKERGMEFFYQTGEIMPGSFGPIVITLSPVVVSDMILFASPLK